MTALFRSIKSETKKLWGMSGTSAALFLLALAMCAVVWLNTLCVESGAEPRFFMQNEIGYAALHQAETDDWRSECEELISGSDAKIIDYGVSIGAATGIQKNILIREKAAYQAELAIAQSRLANNISPVDESPWNIFAFSIWLLAPFTALAAAVASANLFAGEYERGSIRMTLCRPVTRMKQYMAKLLVMLCYSAMLSVMVWLVGMLACIVLMENEPSAVKLLYAGGTVTSVSMMMWCIRIALCCAGAPLISVALCAFIGNLTRSRAAAVSVSLIVVILSYYCGEIVGSLGNVAGFTLFSCLDLTVPLAGLANCADISFNYCAISVAVHWLLLAIAGYFPMRRDFA